MVVHSYGPGMAIVNLHIEVDGSKDIFELHDMIDLIERRITERLGIHSNIHMDPIVTDDEEVKAVRELTLSLVQSIDERMDIHDFRFVRGITHSNLIFDVCAPYELKYSDGELKNIVQEKVSAHNPTYCAVVNIDRK